MSPNYDPARIRAEVQAESTKFFNMGMADLNYLMAVYPKELGQMLPLVRYILDRIYSVNLLVNAGKKWDANIIWRSVLEVFGKFLKITNPANEPELRSEKLNEFWVEIADIERMKDSNWAKKILATDRLKDEKLYEPLVLTEEQENELKAKPTYDNRAYRKALTEGWSFNNIMMTLLKENKTFHLIPLSHLQHKYILLSHIVHGDAWGLNQINLDKQYDEETEVANRLTEFIGFAKAINELLIFMNLELSWIVGEKAMFQENVNNYHRFNPYIRAQAKLAMDELFRLQDERLPSEYR